VDIDRSSPQGSPLWWARVVEWSLVATVIGVVALVLSQQSRVVRGQGELAAVKSTLGALRTALVIDFVRQKARSDGPGVAMTQRNPFELLQRRPRNYLGEMARSKAVFAPAGSWVFDVDCECVGYVPVHGEWFNSPSGDVMAWYDVRGAPGPLEMVAKEVYVWQNQVMD
jgi:hypothetical protein